MTLAPPARFAGVVRILDTVESDLPSPTRLVAEAGLYEVYGNRCAALVVVLPAGQLGIKPGEFTWVHMEPWCEEFWDGDKVRS